jgi:hypothetical protein
LSPTVILVVAGAIGFEVRHPSAYVQECGWGGSGQRNKTRSPLFAAPCIA